MSRCVAPSRARRLLSWGCRTLWSLMSGVLAPCWIERSLPGLPELPPLASEVFGAPPSTRISRCALHPPVSFGPPSEYDEPSHRPVSRRIAPPMRSPASSRHPLRGSVRHGGFHATAAFRPQVFATSRRFAPQDTLRACFIPQARPGFALQGFSLARSRLGSSPTPCPLVVTASDPPLARRRRPKLRFRALLPWRVRCVRFTVKQSERPIPSWAFPSPRLASLRS